MGDVSSSQRYDQGLEPDPIPASAAAASFAKSVKSPVHRIEFGDDIVPHLPPTAIRAAIEEVIAGGNALLRRALHLLLHALKDVGYVGLGPLCYGHPDEKKFHIDLSADAEVALFDGRLRSLTKNPEHWGEHDHLVGMAAEVEAGRRGNYTVLVSPDGWPVALISRTNRPPARIAVPITSRRTSK
ncbi:MAG: hypothetical protein NTY19_05180 [Planctomycetota bacterium]|nr:hypothetical protein [Planctomycetota bacterium]